MEHSGIPYHGGTAAPEFGEDFSATAGEPLAAGVTVAGEEAVIEAMKTVFDPEIPVNIHDLGLIYGFIIDAAGGVKADMSLTAPGCPVAGILPQQVADAAASVTESGEVEVYLVWDPPWDMERMSEEAKLALGFF